MKHLLLILGLILVGNTSYSQITISNDSIFDNAEFVGGYEVRVVKELASKGLRLNISVFSNRIADRSQQYEIEKAIETQLNSQPSNKFLIMFTHLLDKSKLTPTQLTGLDLEKAGKAYNGAAAFSIIGAVGGSALVLSGYPIVGSVITFSTVIIGYIVQIIGNNKLIKGGKELQKQRDVK